MSTEKCYSQGKIRINVKYVHTSFCYHGFLLDKLLHFEQYYQSMNQFIKNMQIGDTETNDAIKLTRHS